MPNRWGRGRGGRPWRRLVESVKRRDRYTCQACARITAEGECDHIVPESQGGCTRMDNLQWMCGACHTLKTRREAAQAQGHRVRPVIGVDGWPRGDPFRYGRGG